ncbi:MAG TPA: hypothetical protein PKV72_04060 [Candidatus Peribacteria bacterium]|nr:hypothetical protein [Candidatus Peribacteria bacterium]
MPILSLPVISTGEDYARDALDGCKAGTCSNCGLCCTTMATVVPSERGNIDSAPVRKSAGEVCPQLVRTNRGRYLCALHSSVSAGDPRLADCAAWSGEGNGILQLTVKTEEWIARPPDGKAAEMITDLIRLKLLAGFRREVSVTEAVAIVRHYVLQLDTCPAEVFDLLGVRPIFRRMYSQQAQAYFQFDRELWVASPNSYKRFFESYVWDGSGPYERDQGRVRFAGP